MENAKLLERKKALEEALLANNTDREAIVEQMLKPAQKSLSELQVAHSALDGRYAEVCDMLDKKPSEEFGAFIKAKQAEIAKKSEAKQDGAVEKPIPEEEAAKPKEKTK